MHARIERQLFGAAFAPGRSNFFSAANKVLQNLNHAVDFLGAVCDLVSGGGELAGAGSG